MKRIVFLSLFVCSCEAPTPIKIEPVTYTVGRSTTVYTRRIEGETERCGAVTAAESQFLPLEFLITHIADDRVTIEGMDCKMEGKRHSSGAISADDTVCEIIPGSGSWQYGRGNMDVRSFHIDPVAGYFRMDGTDVQEFGERRFAKVCIALEGDVGEPEVKAKDSANGNRVDFLVEGEGQWNVPRYDGECYILGNPGNGFDAKVSLDKSGPDALDGTVTIESTHCSISVYRESPESGIWKAAPGTPCESDGSGGGIFALGVAKRDILELELNTDSMIFRYEAKQEYDPAASYAEDDCLEVYGATMRAYESR